MAKLKKDVLDKSQKYQLYTILSQYIPRDYKGSDGERFKNRFMKEVQETGMPSDELMKEIGFNARDKASVLDMTKTITGGKPILQSYTQTELKDQLKNQLIDARKQPISEADLTDEELATRKEIYQSLQGVKNPLEKGTLDSAVHQKLQAYGITNPSYVNTIKKNVYDFYSTNGRFPTYPEIRSLVENQRNVVFNSVINSPAVANFFNDGNVARDIDSIIKASTDEMPDTREGEGRIQTILESRATAKAREGDISTYLDTTIPTELKSGRAQRIKELQELGGKQFERLTPQLLARENALGRLGSGATGDVLTSTASDIQGRIESEAERLKSGDDDFYFNAAYKNQVRKLLEGRTDLSAATNEQRTGVRTQQETRFQTSQYNLDTSLANDLLMQKYQNQLETARTAAERQRSLARNKSQAAGYAGIGSGMVSGAVAGGAMSGWNPYGMAAGAAAGGVTSAIPVVFGDQS